MKQQSIIGNILHGELFLKKIKDIGEIKQTHKKILGNAVQLVFNESRDEQIKSTVRDQE